MSAKRYEALVDDILKRLAPFAKPLSGVAEVKDPLDNGLKWLHRWLKGLKTAQFKINDQMMNDFAKSLHYVAFGWTVQHPKLFSSTVDKQLLHTHKNEKDEIEAMIYAAQQLLPFFMYQATAETLRADQKSGAKATASSMSASVADAAASRDPLGGWQGALLGLLEGLHAHLETRNPASSTSTQDDMSAYRDYVGLQLLEPLVKVVFPTQTAATLPSGPGDPIKDHKGRTIFAPEFKYAAVDVIVESLRRQVTPLIRLRNVLPLETIGSLLHSAYDMHLSSALIDLAYRLLPGLRQQKVTGEASVRSKAIDQLFTDNCFGIAEAGKLRALVDTLDTKDWLATSSSLLAEISILHIKRGQAFVTNDLCYNGEHLLPVQPGKEGPHSKSLTEETLLAGTAFVATSVWFGRDSLTVLIDEPPECTKAREVEEKTTMDVRPSGQPTETRDARARVPYSAIRKIHVRPVASADGGYRVIILLDKPLQIDGRPYKAKASHYGTDIASDPLLAAMAPSSDAFHKLELVLNSQRADLALLKKMLEERKQRYPNLGDELDSFPAIAATVRGGAGAVPAPKAAAKLQAKGQTAANGTAEIVKGGAAVAQTRIGVPKVPRKSSQAKPLEFSGSGEDSAEDAQLEPGAGEENASQDGKGGGEVDLEGRRDKLANMARVGSPSTSATSSRRRSKDDDDAETGDLGNLDQDREFGGGFDDEEAREAALHASMKKPVRQQTEEEDMPSPHRIGRPRAESASPEEDEVDQLDEDQLAVETAQPEKKKQSQPAATNKAGAAAPRAKPSRQAGPPPPNASPPLRRSPRLSPPPPKPKVTAGKTARDENETSGAEEQTRSRQRGGAAAAGKKKQVVQPAAKQKRSRPDNDDDDDDDEALTSLDESSDADDEDFVDTSKKKKFVVQTSKSAAPASKRRKVSDRQSEKEDETDYDEPATLPTKVSRPPVKHKFGKEVGKAPRSNGTTRKANQPPARTTARKKADATANDKLASKSTSKPGSKADKKPPSKPASKSAPHSRVSMSDSASEEADEQSRAGRGRASRAKAKKAVSPAAKKTVLPSHAGDEEHEEPLPKKKGDKRVADDSPPPADLTVSEQSRVKRAAPRSSVKSPGKAKPVQTLDQLTGNAPVPAVDTVAAGDAMEDVEEGAEEQQEIFEADFVMEDVNLEEIAAVFGPDSQQAGTAVKPADEYAGNGPPAPHAKIAEPAHQDPPERIRLSPAPASASALSDVAPMPAGPPAIKDATTKLQDRSGSGATSPKAGIAEEDIARPPAEKEVPKAPLGNDASTSIIAPADSSSSEQQNAPIKPKSEQLLKVTFDTSHAGTATRNRATAPHDDSGVHFVANTAAVRQKEAPAAGSLHRLAESMDVADEEPTAISEEPIRRSERLPISAAKAAGDSLGSTPHRASVNASTSAPTTGQRVAYAPTPNVGRPDLPPSQSTPAQQGVPTAPPAFSLPWSAIPTRTTALRQGRSRATKPPIPTEVRKQAQLATGPTGPEQRTPAYPPAKSARNVARASQPAFYMPPCQQPSRASPGDGRVRTKPDRIILQERPTDTYEQFFELLVDLGQALVSKQREVAADLQRRREIAAEKITKLVTRSVQSDHAQTRNIAKMVAHRAGGVNDDGVSASVQACAIEVADHNAQLGNEVRELLNKLAAEKLA